jgi:hypothetical protein
MEESMRIIPPPLEIGDTEGFHPSKDIFGRKNLGEGLMNLVGTVSDPLVISVDGQWGSGKTTFLKMWAGHLRNAGFPVVYFDSFKHDYMSDAFTAIAGEIIALIKVRKKANSTIGKRFLKSAAGTGKVIAKAGVGIGVKLITLGVLAKTDVEGVASDIGDALADISGDAVGRLLQHRDDEQVVFEEFRSALAELPALLKAGDAALPFRPLIFIIDELDRCRPTFALQLLERVKHFFSVLNVHFVLGVHTGQLQNSVAVVYGAEVDTTTYLQKFITLTFFIYDQADSDRERTARKFLNYLVAALEFDPRDKDIVDTAVGIIGDICVEQDINLRSIERIMTTLAIALAYSPRNILRAAPIIAGLAILKVVAPQLYLKAKRGTLRFNEVQDILALKGEQSPGRSSRREWVAEWWRYSTDGQASDQFVSGLGARLSFDYNIDEGSQIVPLMANEVIDRFQAS